jgi:hypothetical protein
LSFWEFAACVDGFNRANGGDDLPQPMSAQEFDVMVLNSRAMTAH